MKLQVPAEPPPSKYFWGTFQMYINRNTFISISHTEKTLNVLIKIVILNRKKSQVFSLSPCSMGSP